MNKYFNIPQLKLKGDLQSVCSSLIRLTWRYNSLTKKRIEKLISSLDLPNEYIGIHIRKGDKKKEFNLISAREYIKKAELLSDIRVAFILTDDYTVIHELKCEFKVWNFYTLCAKDERGYLHQEFIDKPVAYKHERIINLFASIDILNNSKFFIGTFTSNPGMYLGMRRGKNRCFGMDFKSWCIW
jgi:hypothetical protein